MADTEKYRVLGASNPGQTLSRVIVEGSSTNPKRYADVGDEIELTEEEHTRLKASGVKLRKASDPEEKETSDDSSDDSSGDSPQQTPGGEVPAQSQAAGQAPEGTQSGAASRSGKR